MLLLLLARANAARRGVQVGIAAGTSGPGPALGLKVKLRDPT
jgi:hypothetical protein